MSDVNTVVISGRLAKDPESRKIGDDEKLKVSFSVASNRRWGPTKEQEDTCWVDIEVWGKLAQIAADYCRKGSVVTITGRLSQDKWTTDDGQKRSKHYINATEISLGPKTATEKNDDTDPALVEAVKKTRLLMEQGFALDVAMGAVLGTK